MICWFSKLDCCTKTRLLKAHCFSFYGSELWNLANSDVRIICSLAAGLETYLEVAI